MARREEPGRLTCGVEAAVGGESRLIVYLQDQVVRVVCKCMVWMKGGAARALWLLSNMLGVALAAHPRTRNALCQVDEWLVRFVVIRFLGWPATHTFPDC
jgi:hypothetical protein